ncbi:MAG TPA: hypothetical protein VGZ22_12340, partial [Isosphaeraceae bacterium]|nr:hypothetical protein [Isosphaeraceae bacterium]
MTPIIGESSEAFHAFPQGACNAPSYFCIWNQAWCVSHTLRVSDNCHCDNNKMWLGWREAQATVLASPGENLLMLAQDESAAPATRNLASQKLLQLLHKRLRQLWRVTLVLAIGLALGATALAIWWLTSLNGLPDIGDPFDVAAFRTFSLPDDQNAFTFFRRAW